MGLNVDNSISENYEIVCLLGLTAFVLNEFGSTTYTVFKLHNQMRNEATRYKCPIELEHDLVEDG